jgi:hypothetical protein
MKSARLFLLGGLLVFMAGASQAQSGPDRESPWSLEVLYRSSIPGLLDRQDGIFKQDDSFTVHWLTPVVTSYGVRLRRSIGRSWQCAFGLVPTRRRYKAEVAWDLGTPGGGDSPDWIEGQLDWVFASYGVPVIFRTEVPLTQKILLGAGGGVNMELFPTNATASDFIAQDSLQFAFDQYTQRVRWLRAALAVELGCVFELPDGSGLHLGLHLQRALGHWFRAESYGRLGTEKAEVSTYLSGHHWGLDLRWILP